MCRMFPITESLRESLPDKMDILIFQQEEQILYAVLRERQLEYIRRDSHSGTEDI